MTDTNTTNTELTAAEYQDIDNVLAGIEPDDDMESIEAMDEFSDLDSLEDVNAIEEIAAAEEDETDADAEEVAPVEASGNYSEDEIDDLELAVDKAAAYEAQESAPIGGGEDGKISSEGTVNTRTRSSSSTPRTSTPRAPRDMASVSPECFILNGDASTRSDEDKAAAKTAVMAATPGQKKVAEKFENVFLNMSAGRAPSKYVMTAFAALDKNKTMSSSEVVAAFKTSGVGEGTARSQSGQIMVLFAALGIAERDGKTLKMKEDSNVAEYLRKHVSA